MSMDKGLKPRNALARHRNVLSRDERIDALKDIEKWEDDASVFGLPKVANRKAVIKKEKAAPAEGAAEAAEGEAAAEGETPEGQAETRTKPEARADTKAKGKADTRAKGKGR